MTVVDSRPYVEVGDGQVREAFSSIIANLWEKCLSRVILDKDSIEHVIRLCRVLVSFKVHIST